MEENNIYPEQNKDQSELQPVRSDYDGQEIQFGGQQGDVETPQNDGAQADGGNSSGICADSVYQNGSYQGSHQNDVYTGGNYQNAAYQNNGFQTAAYQNGGGQNNVYQNNGYQNGACRNEGLQNNYYQNGDYSGNAYQSYGAGYQQYYGVQQYPNEQLELEEPVKVSEWVLALVLMMIPCVNIIMMFVWAFSKTEKKSKSNFFKAYLIFFGISVGVMLLVWIAVVIFALML